MASSGNNINWSNLSTAKASCSFTSAFNGTLVMCAQGIAVQAHAKNVLFRKASCYITPYYWNGSGWTSLGQIKAEATTSGTAMTKNSSWYSANNSVNGSQNWALGTNLWRFDISGSATGSSEWYPRIYGYSIGYLDESTYNSIMKGHPIRYTPVDWWRIGSGYTYSTIDAWLAAQNPRVYKGTPITASLAANCCKTNY